MTITQPLEPLARPSLHVELVERLHDLIVEGALPAGAKVPERELCTRFGVSRTPMREALKVLAADGLVSLEPNRGAWVSKVTIEELEEVFPVMGALESLSGELACARITDAQIAEVRTLHDAMLRCFEARDLPGYFRTNRQIHDKILDAAGNATLSAQHRSLAARVRRVRYMARMSETLWRRAVAEHEDIIEALEARDGPALAQHLRRHIDTKFETVRQWITDSDEG